MNKKAVAVITNKYRKVIEAQKEQKEACDNLKKAIDNLKYAMDHVEPGTLTQSEIDYYAEMVEKYNRMCKKGIISTVGKKSQKSR